MVSKVVSTSKDAGCVQLIASTAHDAFPYRSALSRGDSDVTESHPLSPSNLRKIHSSMERSRSQNMKPSHVGQAKQTPLLRMVYSRSRGLDWRNSTEGAEEEAEPHSHSIAWRDSSPAAGTDGALEVWKLQAFDRGNDYYPRAQKGSGPSGVFRSQNYPPYTGSQQLSVERHLSMTTGGMSQMLGASSSSSVFMRPIRTSILGKDLNCSTEVNMQGPVVTYTVRPVASVQSEPSKCKENDELQPLPGVEMERRNSDHSAQTTVRTNRRTSSPSVCWMISPGRDVVLEVEAEVVGSSTWFGTLDLPSKISALAVREETGDQACPAAECGPEAATDTLKAGRDGDVSSMRITQRRTAEPPPDSKWVPSSSDDLQTSISSEDDPSACETLVANPDVSGANEKPGVDPVDATCEGENLLSLDTTRELAECLCDSNRSRSSIRRISRSSMRRSGVASKSAASRPAIVEEDHPPLPSCAIGYTAAVPPESSALADQDITFFSRSSETANDVVMRSVGTSLENDLLDRLDMDQQAPEDMGSGVDSRGAVNDITSDIEKRSEKDLRETVGEHEAKCVNGDVEERKESFRMSENAVLTVCPVEPASMGEPVYERRLSCGSWRSSMAAIEMLPRGQDLRPSSTTSRLSRKSSSSSSKRSRDVSAENRVQANAPETFMPLRPQQSYTSAGSVDGKLSVRVNRISGLEEKQYMVEAECGTLRFTTPPAMGPNPIWRVTFDIDEQSLASHPSMTLTLYQQEQSPLMAEPEWIPLCKETLDVKNVEALKIQCINMLVPMVNDDGNVDCKLDIDVMLDLKTYCHQVLEYRENPMADQVARPQVSLFITLDKNVAASSGSNQHAMTTSDGRKVFYHISEVARVESATAGTQTDSTGNEKSTLGKCSPTSMDEGPKGENGAVQMAACLPSPDNTWPQVSTRDSRISSARSLSSSSLRAIEDEAVSSPRGLEDQTALFGMRQDICGGRDHDGDVHPLKSNEFPQPPRSGMSSDDGVVIPEMALVRSDDESVGSEFDRDAPNLHCSFVNVDTKLGLKISGETRSRAAHFHGIRVECLRGERLFNPEVFGTPDPYVRLRVGDYEIESAVQPYDVVEPLALTLPYNMEKILVLEIWDHERIMRNRQIGQALINLKEHINNGPMTDMRKDYSLDLIGPDNAKGGHIDLRLHLVPANLDPCANPLTRPEAEMLRLTFMRDSWFMREAEHHPQTTEKTTEANLTADIADGEPCMVHNELIPERQLEEDTGTPDRKEELSKILQQLTFQNFPLRTVALFVKKLHSIPNTRWLHKMRVAIKLKWGEHEVALEPCEVNHCVRLQNTCVQFPLTDRRYIRVFLYDYRSPMRQLLMGVGAIDTRNIIRNFNGREVLELEAVQICDEDNMDKTVGVLILKVDLRKYAISSPSVDILSHD